MKTVLFADDDKTMGEICRRILEDEGYRVVLAHDGVEAIGAVETESPDVVILDVHMPRQNGLEAAEKINAIDPGIPIVLYTGYDDACTRDHRSRFAAACVEKSQDFTEVLLAVNRVLAPDRLSHLFRVGLPPKVD